MLYSVGLMGNVVFGYLNASAGVRDDATVFEGFSSRLLLHGTARFVASVDSVFHWLKLFLARHLKHLQGLNVGKACPPSSLGV